MKRPKATKVTQQRLTLQLERPEPTCLAVVADTHSLPHPETLTAHRRKAGCLVVQAAQCLRVAICK